MKKTILFIAVLLVATTIQAQKKIKGNGNMTTVTRTTSDYDGIKCAGSFDYVLVAGTEGKITIEGEENLIQYIITEVKGGNLIIKTENKINLQVSNNNTIKITIPFKDISAVSMAGSGNLWNENKITSTDMNVSIAGSGAMKLKMEASSTKASIAGSGDLTLTGSTNNLDASVAGSGEFHGFDLLANNTEISVAGSGVADVVCNKSLKANVAGSGDIRYIGNPKIESTKVAGSGSIESK
ncbi:MAG: head GIN domain-containing protein [Aquaticitalea sp.]